MNHKPSSALRSDGRVQQVERGTKCASPELASLQLDRVERQVGNIDVARLGCLMRLRRLRHLLRISERALLAPSLIRRAVAIVLVRRLARQS